MVFLLRLVVTNASSESWPGHTNTSRATTLEHPKAFCSSWWMLRHAGLLQERGEPSDREPMRLRASLPDLARLRLTELAIVASHEARA